MTKSIHSDRYKKVVSKLIEARKKQGLTQRQLAAKVGKYITFVSKYEIFERRLDIVEFVDVCKALGLEPQELLQIIN